ncbi:FAD:protein FMN transferase [Vibrio alginolyticus]|uniref:FAD:protein FMN transferase n=1 Tax=Vibrio alginolyticus TaxID=663 RepID=UPI0024DE3DF7|nr:FAD:protein FMN transferase [Vibrio alginolyticus]
MISATYRHYFDQDGLHYAHIIDARPGTSVTHHTVSVTVLHDDPSGCLVYCAALAWL